MTHHLDERPSLGHITSPFPQFLNVSLQPLSKTNPSHNNPENKFVRIPTVANFVPKIVRKILFLFFMLIRAMIMRAPNYCYLSFFLFHTQFSVFPEQKIQLSSLI